MLGETQTIVIDGANKVLSRINQDNFGATYLLLEPTGEIQMQVRHNKEKSKLGQPARDRHNVRILQTIFGAAGAPDVVREISTTLVANRSDDRTAFSKVTTGVNTYMSAATVVKVLNWES